MKFVLFLIFDATNNIEISTVCIIYMCMCIIYVHICHIYIYIYCVYVCIYIYVYKVIENSIASTIYHKLGGLKRAFSPCGH